MIWEAFKRRSPLQQASLELSHVRILVIVWTAVIATSLLWNRHQLIYTIENQAVVQARAAIEQDILYRKWNAQLGGVYAEIQGDMQPNPYLKSDERDITTTSGRQLTLVNPAYMTRQVHELGNVTNHTFGHITSLNPIRPENAADEWETVALQAFEQGETEWRIITDINDMPYLRLMRPLITEESCLKCHEVQGYQVGEIRGGLSVSVPLADLMATIDRSMNSLMLGHGLLWLIGLVGIEWAERRLKIGAEKRNRAEIALRKMNETLEEQVAIRTAEILAEQEKSDAILRSVGDAIAVVDLSGHILYINEAYTTITGYTAVESLGHKLDFITHRPHLATARATNNHTEIWQAEVTLQRKNGTFYDAALTVAPVLGSNGHLTSYVSSHRDISKIKALDNAQRQFMTNVSHELRTPLSNLHLYVHLLRNGNPDKQDYYYDTLVNQTDRLTNLITGILEITSLDSGRFSTNRQIVSLAKVTQTVIERYQLQVNTTALTMTLHPIPPDLPDIWGDASLLAQALSKLLDNAILLTESGGQIDISLAVTAVSDQTWATLSVTDTGPGIPPQDLEHIFKRFFRGTLTHSGTIPGTGLGLSIAQEIIKAHGGKITVETVLNEGSTFTIWLQPAADPHLPPAQESAQDALPHIAAL